MKQAKSVGMYVWVEPQKYLADVACKEIEPKDTTMK